jgi:hypothetical protein
VGKINYLQSCRLYTETKDERVVKDVEARRPEETLQLIDSAVGRNSFPIGSPPRSPKAQSPGDFRIHLFSGCFCYEYSRIADLNVTVMS